MKRKIIAGGLTIVFEGLDGVGKTTQLKLAEAELMRQGWQVTTTRNLGGTPIGEALRQVMKSEIPRPTKTNLYISVAIQEALLPVIAEARQQNQIILMDRGPLSLAAYEIYGGGLAERLGWQYVDNGMDNLKPELTILFRADVKTAVGRLKDQPKTVDYFESQPLSYFEAVSNGYEVAAKRYSDRLIIIDANQPIEAIHDQTMAAIMRLVGQANQVDQ